MARKEMMAKEAEKQEAEKEERESREAQEQIAREEQERQVEKQRKMKEEHETRVREFLRSAQVQSGFMMSMSQRKLSPLLVGVCFNAVQKGSGIRSLVRLRRYGHSLAHLKSFIKPVEGGAVCTLNGEWLLDTQLQTLEDTLLRNETNRFILETLEPIFVGSQQAGEARE